MFRTVPHTETYTELYTGPHTGSHTEPHTEANFVSSGVLSAFMSGCHSFGLVCLVIGSWFSFSVSFFCSPPNYVGDLK